MSPAEAQSNFIIFFDDLACEKQDNVKAFFCMGRHKSVDCFYLCQSYAHVPKYLVRDNVNLLAVFWQDDVDEIFSCSFTFHDFVYTLYIK